AVDAAREDVLDAAAVDRNCTRRAEYVISSCQQSAAGAAAGHDMFDRERAHRCSAREPTAEHDLRATSAHGRAERISADRDDLETAAADPGTSRCSAEDRYFYPAATQDRAAGAP